MQNPADHTIEERMAAVSGLNARAMTCLRVAAQGRAFEPAIVAPLLTEAMNCAENAYQIIVSMHPSGDKVVALPVHGVPKVQSEPPPEKPEPEEREPA